MKRIIVALMLALTIGCSSYRESMQGKWELVEIRNEEGDKVYEVCRENGQCDVVDLTFESKDDLLTITAHDASGREMKATYLIKEDGRLVNTNDSRPNMYILDIDMNKVVLIEREMDEAGHERMLVFKKVAQ